MMAIRVGAMRSLLLLCVVVFIHQVSSSELLIFVENPGGELLQENVTTFGQHIVISFERSDSSAVSLWYDYNSGVQAFRFLVSGEEELNQAGVSRTVCYAVFFDRDSLVPVNAMYKLRQRNAHVVRFAEMDKGREEMFFDTKISTDSFRELSPHISNLCVDSNVIFTRQTDIKSWSSFHGEEIVSRLKSTKVVLNPVQQVFCSSNPAPWAPCSCRLTTCILWYPCALRFCENSGVCGIRTCSKCYDMYHTEEGVQKCIE